MTQPKSHEKSQTQRSPSREAQGQVEGEGSYTATRRYNERLKKHLQTSDVEAEAEQAREALEGDERGELEEAEARGKAGPARKSGTGR